MATKKSVNIGTQTIFGFIPYLNLYAFYRIEKFWIGLGILFGVNLGIGIPLSMILPFPYHYFVLLGVYAVIPVQLLRKWSKEWNERIAQSGS